MLGWTYGMFQTNVIEVERNPYILCFSYMWYGNGKGSIRTVSMPDFKLYKKEPHNDYEVVKKLRGLLDEADIVIAHNANGFDNKVSSGRFLFHGLTPPSPYKTVDTLTVARSKFKLWSNSLDNLGKQLSFGQKTQEKHGQLWKGCVEGEKDAWKKMSKYCKQDVWMLHQLYELERPFITNHPNLANYMENDVCPKCGSKKLQYRGYQKTNVATYHRVQCQDCGGWSRERIKDEYADKPMFV